MWKAMAVVTALQVAVLGAAVLMFDWDAEAMRAQAGVLRGKRSMGDFALGVASGEGMEEGARADVRVEAEGGGEAAAVDHMGRKHEEGRGRAVLAIPHPRHGIHEPLVGVSSRLTD